DAKFHGIDLDFAVRPAPRIVIEGTANYVRGERRDIEDDLYRVPPLNGRLAAAFEGNGFAVGAELVAASDQANVSSSLDEEASDGCLVAGLFGQVLRGGRVRLEGGVENLFGTYSQPHLAGRNRVAASDVPVGERLPGHGRGV